MKYLSEAIFEEFTHGNFTIKKSHRAFSATGIDQAHEQNNKVVKIDGGAIGILDDGRALLQWAISGPVISEMMTDSSHASNEISLPHHEDTETFEINFRKHHSLLIDTLKKFGNPFDNPPVGLQNNPNKYLPKMLHNQLRKLVFPVNNKARHSFKKG